MTMDRKHENRGSASAAAVVAIFALALLAGAYFIFLQGSDLDPFYVQETTVVHEHETEDDGPDIDVDLVPGGDEEPQAPSNGSSQRGE